MSNAFIQHQARLMQHAATRKSDKPTGNYDHAEHQWGVIAAVNVGPPASVDVYLNATAADPSATPSPGLSYLSSYAPTVGDVVLIYRGMARNRSDRVVLGKLEGAASPYPVLLGNIDPASRRWIQGPSALWGGTGEPSAALGNDGDFYFRGDTPSVIGQQVYAKASGEWSEILGVLQGVTQILAGDGITIDPLDGEGAVTINADVGVTQIIAGDSIIIDPADGEGVVTISTTTPYVFPQLSGAGEPEGVVTAGSGTAYQDLATGAIYLKVSGVGNTGWFCMSGAYESGPGPSGPGLFTSVASGLFLVELLNDESDNSGGMNIRDNSTTGLVIAEDGASTLSLLGNDILVSNGDIRGAGKVTLQSDSAGGIELVMLSDGGTGFGPILINTNIGSPGILIENTGGDDLFIWNEQGGIHFKTTTHESYFHVYNGNPNGNLAGTEGDLCVDISSPGLWQCTTTGSTSTAVWAEFGVAGAGVTELVAGTNITLTPSGGTGVVTIDASGGGGSFPTSSGAGSPLGVVTPGAVTDSYQDTTSGAIYLATDLTPGGWVCLGGVGDATATGINESSGGGTLELIAESDLTIQSPVTSIGGTVDGISTAPPASLDSVTATAAFGQIALGTPLQNTSFSDLLVTVVVPVTSSAGGYLVKGVQYFGATPPTGPATPPMTVAAEQYVTITAWVPANSYLLIDTSGTITCGTPVTTAEVL